MPQKLITDEDLDALLAKGEERTKSLSDKIKRDVGHTLANFSLTDVANADMSIFSFDGQDYSETSKRGKRKSDAGMAETFINLPQRERKRNYDVDTYYREAMGLPERDPTRERKPRGAQMHDFQFFDRPRLERILNKEAELSRKRKELGQRIRELRQQERAEVKKLKRRALDAAMQGVDEEDEAAVKKAKEEAEAAYQPPEFKSRELEREVEQLVLDKEDQAEKDELMAQGFGHWSRTDFRRYVMACERFGRNEVRARPPPVPAAGNGCLDRAPPPAARPRPRSLISTLPLYSWTPSCVTCPLRRARRRSRCERTTRCSGSGTRSSATGRRSWSASRRGSRRFSAVLPSSGRSR